MLNSQDFQYHKPVTPYICSTPLDFLNEKKHLSECIYPELSKACKARGSYFKPTNLLWEPGAQNLVKGLYLKTQLDAINRCSPFFIGLLGETYGPFRDESRELLTEFETSSININHLHWLDKNIMLAAAGGHPWVLDKDHQYCSLTELEITFGTMRYEDHYVTLYYRTSDHLDDKLLNAKLAEKDSLMNIYLAESEHAKNKINKLKQRLVNKGVPIKYFRTCEELGQMVLEDWLQILNILVPSLKHDGYMFETKQHKEWLAQECFSNCHVENFVASEELEHVFQQLTDFVLNSGEHKTDLNKNIVLHSSLVSSNENKRFSQTESNTNVILLVGERGIGKSTLVAQWLKLLKDEGSNTFVVSHFVSASCHSSSIKNFIRQSIRKLRSHFMESGENRVLSLDFEPCM